VNANSAEAPVRLDVHGMQNLDSTATVVTLAGDPTATNSIDRPQAVAPVTSKISGVQPEFVYNVPADSVVVVVLKSR
jgi:alpha-L-arabinofuranosidase